MDRLHPELWKNGKTFPKNHKEIYDFMGREELRVGMTENHARARYMWDNNQRHIATSSYSHQKVMLTSFSRVVRHKDSPARETALVLVNFMISPKAQSHQGADLKNGGMPSVLDPKSTKIPEAYRKGIKDSRLGMVTALPETHQSWDTAISKRMRP
jgi:putative thiamine transport system substrate-binding protein